MRAGQRLQADPVLDELVGQGEQQDARPAATAPRDQRYTIGATLEEQTTPSGQAILADDTDAVEGADRLARAVRVVADLGPDHEFEAGLTALVRGLAPLDA